MLWVTFHIFLDDLTTSSQLEVCKSLIVHFGFYSIFLVVLGMGSWGTIVVNSSIWKVKLFNYIHIYTSFVFYLCQLFLLKAWKLKNQAGYASSMHIYILLWFLDFWKLCNLSKTLSNGVTMIKWKISCRLRNHIHQIFKIIFFEVQLLKFWNWLLVFHNYNA